MKKILFSLVALVCSMSMNAQVLKVMKDGEVVKKYNGANYEFVFEEAPGTTGSTKRTGDVDVKWVQLWEDGPRFAEYNVGATSETECGGYYCWGESTDKDLNSYNYSSHTYNTTLTSTDDTATNLWGSNWRMPTSEELSALLTKCDVVWTSNYNNSGTAGLVITGKDDYNSNSMFLPAAGGFSKYGGQQQAGPGVVYQNSEGRYWSSSSNRDYQADRLFFDLYDRIQVGGVDADGQFSVRAVLAE